MLPFNLSSPIAQYNKINNPPRRHEAAKFVRTLPMIAGLCSLRSFVEIWSLCCSRSDEFYEKRNNNNIILSSEEESDKKGTRKRRNGQFVFKNLPFAVVLLISEYLKHLPVLRLPSDNFSYSKLGTYWDIKDLIGERIDIVEDMQFDMDRVVSFYLRISVGGRVVKDSRFFINPDMTIGVWIPKYDLTTKETDENDEEKKEVEVEQSESAQQQKQNTTANTSSSSNQNQTLLQSITNALGFTSPPPPPPPPPAPRNNNNSTSNPNLFTKQQADDISYSSPFSASSGRSGTYKERQVYIEYFFFDRMKLKERPIPTSKENRESFAGKNFLLPTDGSVLLLDPRLSEVKGILRGKYYVEGKR